MTREEFFEQTGCIGDLSSFCYENCMEDIFEDIYDSDTISDYIYDRISEGDCSWIALRDYLNEVPNIYDGLYYRVSGYFDIEELGDSDYEELRDIALDRAYDLGMIDDDDDDDDDECEDVEEDEEVCDIDSIISMVGACVDYVKDANEKGQKEIEEMDRSMNDYIKMFA